MKKNLYFLAFRFSCGDSVIKVSACLYGVFYRHLRGAYIDSQSFRIDVIRHEIWQRRAVSKYQISMEYGAIINFCENKTIDILACTEKADAPI